MVRRSITLFVVARLFVPPDSAEAQDAGPAAPAPTESEAAPDPDPAPPPSVSEEPPSGPPPSRAPVSPDGADLSESDEIGWGDDDSVGVGDADAAGGDASGTLAEPPVPTPLAAWRAAAKLRATVGLWAERLDESALAVSRVAFESTARYEDGLLRVGVGVHGEYDAAYLAQRDDWDPAVFDEYESQMYLVDTYVALAGRYAELQVGRTVEVWGEGEVLSPLDVVSAKDLREPGLADLEDLRLPSLSTRAGLFFGYHRLETVIVHEGNFGFRSPPGGPFTLVDPLLAKAEIDPPALDRSTRFAYDHQPSRFGGDAQQLFVRWTYQGPALDAGVYGAYALDQLGVVGEARGTLSDEVLLEPNTPPPMPEPELNAVRLDLQHLRYGLLGASAAVNVGSFLVRIEARGLRDLALNTSPSPGVLSHERYSLLGGMAGVSYAGLSDTRLVLEYAKDWVLGDGGELLFPVEQPTVAFRAERSFLREDLTLSMLFFGYGYLIDYGWLTRFEVSYNFGNALVVAVGAITYQPSERLSPIAAFDTHDRVYAKVGYDL